MKHLALLFLIIGTVASIVFHLNIIGYLFFIASLVTAFVKNKDLAVHLGVIILPLVLLTTIEITTDTSTGHVLSMGAVCLFAILFPFFTMKAYGKPIEYKLFSKKQWQFFPVAYLIVGFIIAYFVLPWYFTNYPVVPANWPQPEVFTWENFWRLFAGTNMLGIWDELFFINSIFALLLRFYDFRVALVSQAVLFTSFLYELGFVAIGPIIIFVFAILQGIAYKKTESLSYVIILHLLIDAVLFTTIINYYYPGSFLFFG